jgi:hypothetical protein
MTVLPNSLPMLDYLTDHYPKNTLKDTYLICCQHVLPSLSYFMKSAQMLGLPKENISIIGKCYSASKLAYNMLIKDGLFVSEKTFAYTSHLSFDEQFSLEIDAFLKSALKKINLSEGKKIIILDDGGELLRSANTHLKGYPNLLGVEQTSSGYNKLKDVNLHFPIINVARSYAKLQLESPHIAKSILNQLKTVTTTHDKHILIIGKGIIGSQLASIIAKKIDYYDIQCNQPIHKIVDLKQYDMIIGATGDHALDSKYHQQLKPNTFLVSVSSSDREFQAVELRKQIAVSNNCHEHLRINNINLINSGFPLNFYGSDYDNIPLHDIQLTVALLFAGICQDTDGATGFLELNSDMQALLSELTEPVY